MTTFLILILGGLFCFFFKDCLREKGQLLDNNSGKIIWEKQRNENDKNTARNDKVKNNDGANNKNKETSFTTQRVEMSVKNENKNNDKNDVKVNNENLTLSSERTIGNTGKNNDKNEKQGVVIKNKLVNWGFTKSSGRKIDTIILHSSYDALGNNPYDLDGLIAEYKQYSVAPHYLIDRKGNIYRLVADKNIAWHAGVSQTPDGRKNVNNFSIGIELMNTKTDDYTKKQYQATQKLIDYLKKEYKIKYILGHNEIAPGRKTDPWNFDWEKIKR